ncbi:hypothetical protein D1B31_18075 [Neobacillus notoginsengisoli]|uniref:Uncharacterized protein n=1 Tax=Neobacillus notoginsengisoli TaxID=1578198 RepID=A0A417YQJ8_9BACI|nr:hypothetical protein [Neobacillus notoginsengisoli]RHW35996.1 hypothetical protein D1B31_18075 [Neobacillus notoginsengisoli]
MYEMKGLIQQHKDKLTTVREWDAYASQHNLPSSSNLIYIFGSWNDTKKAFGLSGQKSSYSLDELKEIATTHKKHMVNKRTWDKYSKENGLPASATFIKAFGKWTDVKNYIGIGNEKRKRDLYSEEQIKKILKEHAAQYINRQQWDIYAKENQLPTYKTIKKHFSYDEILKIVGKRKKIKFTQKDLLQIALKHEEIFLSSSMSSWDKYASENKLPTSSTFFNCFGSWRKAKQYVRLNM